MIYSEEDYKDAAKYKHSFDIDQVAKEIEKKIKADSDIAYDGYLINRKTCLINFCIKTADGREWISYDPCTLNYHIQNSLWISEFDETSIFRLLVIFSELRYKWNLKAMKGGK